jgi:hypothetical protein
VLFGHPTPSHPVNQICRILSVSRETMNELSTLNYILNGTKVGNRAILSYILGVPKKTGHCLISCNVKATKAIAMK